MKLARRFPLIPLLACVAIAIGENPDAARAQAPAQKPLDQQLFEQGIALGDQDKYDEAAKAFESLAQKYPNSPLAPQANFRAGYALYRAGDYDKSIDKFRKLSSIKGVDATLLEIADSMVPQILMAEASKMEVNEKAKEGAYREAAREFDAFTKKYPKSREVETANYSRSLCLYQIAQYEDAMTALRENLQKFPQSQTILDSEYLLGLTIGTVANIAAEKATAPDPAIDKYYDDAEKILRDVINKRTNLALLNDSQFQIGELLFVRGSHAPDKEKPAMLQRAIEAYRGVFPKDAVVNAQRLRVEQFRQAARQAGDLASREYFNRVADKEFEKIANLEGRAEQTLTAKLKTGIIYFMLNKPDEARVVFSVIEPFLDDITAKKQILYFTTITYAMQRNAAKAVEKYDAFKAGYRGDPIAENLDLVIGGMFLAPDTSINNPEKAIEYFKRGVAEYPKGRYLPDLTMQQAMALIDLKKYDEARTILQEFLAKNPAKDLAVAAEYGLGIIAMKTDKNDEAIKTFRAVRDKYPGTEQSMQAAYYAGQLLLAKDPKQAAVELGAFVAKNPDSELMPEALYALGRGQLNSNQKEAAFKTFDQLIAKYPQSQPAPYAYFEKARTLSEEEKIDEVMALLKDFIAKYQDNDALYQAYDFLSQLHTTQGKGMEAIADYEDFVAKKPGNPNAATALGRLAGLWKGYTESLGPYLALPEEKRAEWKQGAEKSIAASERIVNDYPDSPSVGLALGNFLEVFRLEKRVRLKTDEDIERYFTALAEKTKGSEALHAKIVFTLAAFNFEKDRAKALSQMQQVYKPGIKFGAGELDLYGLSLIESKRYDDALAIYRKIADDYATPPGTDPTKAPRDVQDAQAIAAFGISKTLQAQAAELRAQNKSEDANKKSAEAGAKSEELKRLYGWSKKAIEANYPLAQSLHDEKKDDEAIKLLLAVVKAKEATPELRARSMLLLGKIHEANERYEFAIDNYMKIAAYYAVVADAAAEGLWRGGQLLERQASGQIPMPTPAPKPPATSKAAGAPTPNPASSQASPEKK